MFSTNLARNIENKQHRCQQIVNFTQNPTNVILICNAGLSTGLKSEILIENVSKYCRIKDVLMIPGKSYCFLIFYETADSVRVFKEMHGISKLGPNDGVLCLSYIQEIPEIVFNVDNPWNLNKPFPDGVILIEDFITEDEEQAILEQIQFNVDAADSNLLKHLQVKHFGYEFLYGTNNIDLDKPLDKKIPSSCDILWERLLDRQPNLAFNVPDQMTANRYEPGTGISPHVDTHSAFEDPIFMLSLLGDTVMEFHKDSNHHSFIYLKKRSFLVMSGESRYGWTHGITPRTSEIIPSTSSGLSIQNRTTRVSLTFRKLKFTPCECQFKMLCDTCPVSLAHIYGGSSRSPGLPNGSFGNGTFPTTPYVSSQVRHHSIGNQSQNSQNQPTIPQQPQEPLPQISTLHQQQQSPQVLRGSQPLLSSHLKCGVYASLGLAVVFVAGANFYFDRHGIEVVIFCAFAATFFLAACGVSFCRRPHNVTLPPTVAIESVPRLERENSNVSNDMGAIQINVQNVAPPPAYDIAILLPETAKEDMDEEAPPPSYDNFAV